MLCMSPAISASSGIAARVSRASAYAIAATSVPWRHSSRMRGWKSAWPAPNSICCSENDTAVQRVSWLPRRVNACRRSVIDCPDGLRNAEFASLRMRAASAASAPITCATRVRGARGSSRTCCTRTAMPGSEGSRTSPLATSRDSLRMTPSRSVSPPDAFCVRDLPISTAAPQIAGSRSQAIGRPGIVFRAPSRERCVNCRIVDRS